MKEIYIHLGIVLKILIYLSCTGSLEDRVKTRLDKENDKNEAEFEKMYVKKIKIVKNSDSISLVEFRSKILHSLNLIEIAEGHIRSLSDDQLGNTKEIAQLLDNSPLGDSLFASLIMVFDFAKNIKKSQSRGEIINSHELEIFRDRSLKELKAHYFGMNTKEGSLMLLKSGFKDELYIIGIQVLSDY